MSYIMLVIFAVLFTTVFANSHEKYIDLLTEEEKQEFLDKVARRIMETVENVEEGQISRELTDDQLKGHSKFVKEILKQEAESFKKLREENNKTINENNAEKNLKVKPLIPNQNENDESSKINKIKPLNNDDTLHGYSTDYLNVETFTENLLSMQKRSLKAKGESNKKESVENMPIKILKGAKLTTDKLTDSEIYRVKMITEDPEVIQSTSEITGLVTEDINPISTLIYKHKTNNKQITGSNPGDNLDLQEISVAESSSKSILPVDIESSTINSDRNLQHITTVEKTVHSEYSSVVNDGNENILVTTNSNSEKNSKVNSDTKAPLTNKKTNDKVTQEDYSITPPSLTDFNIATTVHSMPLSENQVPNDVTTTRNAASTILPILTTTDTVEFTGKFPKKKKIKKIVKQSENTTLIRFVASNALKKAKGKYILNRQKIPLIKNPYKPIKVDRILNPYQIFEIPSPVPDKTPFLRSLEPVLDSPILVPVYKYSPNFAYYNPTNRLGPNAVEENSIELDTQPLREGTHVNGEAASEFILKLGNEMRKFSNYVNHKYDDSTTASSVTKTPEVSVEYSVEFTHLPDSDEERHPINSMKDGLKTHIRAIRDILHKHNHFRPDGPSKKKKYYQYLYSDQDILEKYGLNHHNKTPAGEKSSEESEERPIIPILRTNYDNNIDIDYYFGRMKHRNQETNKEAIKKLKTLQNNNQSQTKRDVIILNYAKDLKNRPIKHRMVKTQKKSVDFNSIAKILALPVEKDIIIDVKKLPGMQLKSLEKNKDTKVGVHKKVLKRLIEENNKALKQYDWLGTTVQVQSALEKLLKLIRTMKKSEPLHPSDVQILKYVTFLHNFATELKGTRKVTKSLETKLLPMNKKKKNSGVLNEEGVLNRIWLYLRTLLPAVTDDYGLDNLNEFLLDVQKALFDLHEAISNISKVTKFKRQHWFEDLKQLYLTTNEKHLQEVLLHLSFARLIELIELGDENGLQEDFVDYMKSHKMESKRALEEMVFVTRIVEEIKKKK